MVLVSAAMGRIARADGANPLAASSMGQGPSLHETGRLGHLGLAESGAQIQETSADPTVAKEKAIDAIQRRPAPVPGGGVMDDAVLSREIQARFGRLNACPVEVARHRRAAPAPVVARRLTLRWTILPTGQVTETAVVATSPVSIQVMDCVKRQMSLWSFTRPRGGPVRVERPFTFRQQRRPSHAQASTIS